MKKHGMALAAVVAGVLMAQSVSAVIVYVDRIPGYYSGQGGEFTMSQTGLNLNYNSLATYTYTDGPLDGTLGFQTFCLEKNEYVSIPGTYEYTIESYAIAGGNGGYDVSVGGDPLSWGTVWLYKQFADGSLAALGYDYTVGVGRPASAALLQNAFWWLEGELGVYGGGNAFVDNAITQFGTSAFADATAGAYGVWAINPTSNNGRNLHQSMLVRIRVPDGGATVAMLGLALLGCVGLKRRLLK